jgi:hypothetical protein
LGSDVFFVRELIRRGVPVNQPDAEWHTAFYLAVKAGYTDIAAVLLENGAMTNDILDGLTLLGQLASEGFGLPKARFQWLLERTPGDQIVKFLGSPRFRRSVFHLLAGDQRAIRQPAWARDLLEYFLEQVADKRLLDLQDIDLNTALHLAVKSNNMETVWSLVMAGATPNLRNYEGKTPLALAKEQGISKNKDLIALLEVRSTNFPPPAATTKANAEEATKSWRVLGLPNQVSEWLDTAMVGVLTKLRDQLLQFFRSDEFLQTSNPWKPVNQIIHTCVTTNHAIVDKEQRTRDFEYALTQMLLGFADAVTLKVEPVPEGSTLLVTLVKPLDRQARRMPMGLFDTDIKFPSLAPGIKSIAYRPREVQHSESEGGHFSPRDGPSTGSTRGILLLYRTLCHDFTLTLTTQENGLDFADW